MDNKLLNIWEELYKESVRIHKDKEIIDFILKIANPKNWGCSACVDDVYGCDGINHCYDVWVDNSDNPVLMDQALELLMNKLLYKK